MRSHIPEHREIYVPIRLKSHQPYKDYIFTSPEITHYSASTGRYDGYFCTSENTDRSTSFQRCWSRKPCLNGILFHQRIISLVG